MQLRPRRFLGVPPLRPVQSTLELPLRRVGVPELPLLAGFLQVARVLLPRHALVGLHDEALHRTVAVVAAVLGGDETRRRRPGLRLLRVADGM